MEVEIISPLLKLISSGGAIVVLALGVWSFMTGALMSKRTHDQVLDLSAKKFDMMMDQIGAKMDASADAMTTIAENQNTAHESSEAMASEIALGLSGATSEIARSCKRHADMQDSLDGKFDTMIDLLTEIKDNGRV